MMRLLLGNLFFCCGLLLIFSDLACQRSSQQAGDLVCKTGETKNSAGKCTKSSSLGKGADTSSGDDTSSKKWSDTSSTKKTGDDDDFYDSKSSSTYRTTSSSSKTSTDTWGSGSNYDYKSTKTSSNTGSKYSDNSNYGNYGNYNSNTGRYGNYGNYGGYGNNSYGNYGNPYGNYGNNYGNYGNRYGNYNTNTNSRFGNWGNNPYQGRVNYIEDNDFNSQNQSRFTNDQPVVVVKLVSDNRHTVVAYSFPEGAKISEMQATYEGEVTLSSSYNNIDTTSSGSARIKGYKVPVTFDFTYDRRGTCRVRTLAGTQEEGYRGRCYR